MHYFSTSILVHGLTFVTMPIFTRYLKPVDYGIIALFTMFGNVSVGLISIGLSNASFRYYFQLQDNAHDFRVLNSSNLMFNLVVFILFGFIFQGSSALISKHIFDGQINPDLISLSFFSGCLEYFTAYFTLLLTARGASKIFSTITTIRYVLNAILSLLFILVFNLTYEARIYGTVLSQIVATVVSIWFCRASLGFSFSFHFLKKSLKFSYPTIPMNMLGLAYTSVDKTMLNKYTGTVSVGYYDFGERFSLILKLIMDSMARVWSPFFLEQAQKNTEEAKQAIVKRYYSLIFFLMTCALGVSAFTEELLVIFTTPEFYPAKYITPLFVYYYLGSITAYLSSNQVMHSGKLMLQMPSSIIGVIINIGLNIILIKRYGAIGAAMTTVIAAHTSAVVLFHYSNKALPLPLKKGHIRNLFLVHIVFSLILYLILMSEMHFFLKIILKTFLIFGFLFCGTKFNFVTLDEIFSIVRFRTFKKQAEAT